MKIRRIVALMMSVVLMLSASVGYAGTKYQYLFDNAAGKVYLVTTDDGWKFMYFEGNNRMACQGYEGLSTKVKLPTEVDGHPVIIGNMNIPYGQIDRYEIPEYFSEVNDDTFGGMFNLKKGCTVVIYNRNAKLVLPVQDCIEMGYVLSGYPGSTTQSYAENFGINFVAIGATATANEKPYLEIDAGFDTGLTASAAGGKGMDVNISSNVAWRVKVTQGSEWVTLSTTNETGNGSFYTTTAANSGEERRGVIEVSANGCDTIKIPVVQEGAAVEKHWTDLIESEGGIVASLEGNGFAPLDDMFTSVKQNTQETEYFQVMHNGKLVYADDVVQLRNTDSITLTIKMLENIEALYDIHAADVCVWNDLENKEEYSWVMGDVDLTWITEDTFNVTLKNSYSDMRLKSGQVRINVAMKNGDTCLITLCSFLNRYSDAVDERLTIDGITVDMTYGRDQLGETFSGKKDSNGNYMSAVWFNPYYAEIDGFEEESLFLGIWDFGAPSSIDSKYVVEIGDGIWRVERAISHILYLSPEDVKRYSYFMDNEAKIQCGYGLCYLLCSCMDIDLAKYLPYEDMMLLLFDENFHTEEGELDLFTAVELIADYLAKAIGEEHPAVKMLVDCKKFIRIDELTRAMNRGGLVEVGKKWKEILDVNGFLLQASQWAFKYDVNALVQYLEGSAKGVLGALTKSIEMGIKSGLVLGSSVAQMKKKNAMKEFVEKHNAPIAIAFYYSPVHKEFQYSMFTVESKESKVNELSNGAFDFTCIANEKIGLSKWNGLRELSSPKHNAGTLRGGVTFDREMVWRILLRFLT